MDSLAQALAATTGHDIGCSCWFCRRERKHLRDEAEADHRADLETALPPVKEEARALFEMIGRNGDTVESIRELIVVPPKIETWLLEQTRHSPRGRRGILKVLNFRRRVLAEFERLVTGRAKLGLNAGGRYHQVSDWARYRQYSRKNVLTVHCSLMIAFNSDYSSPPKNQEGGTQSNDYERRSSKAKNPANYLS